MIDITRALSEMTCVWPGDLPISISKDSWSKTGPNVSSIALSVHAGTHVDAPLHYDDNGNDVTMLDLNCLIGDCRVVERHAIDSVTESDRRVLIKTAASLLDGQAYIESDFGLSVNETKMLINKGVSLIGTDTPSIGRIDETGDEAHRLLLSKSIVIVEGLNLSTVEQGYYKLVCLPMKIMGCEAAPVRAVLLNVEEEIL